MSGHAAEIERLECRNLLSSISHAPTGTSGTVATTTNTAYTLKTADFGFSDPNDSPPNNFTAVKFPTLPNAGTLSDNGTPLTAGQFVTVSDIGSGKLVFTPSPSLPSGTYFMARFQVQDDGSTANGGQNLDPTPKVLDVQVSAFNHAPVGTSGTIVASETTPYVFKTSDFGFTDPNDDPANGFLAVKVDLLPNSGTLKDNGVSVVVGDFVSVADINAGKFIFVPNYNVYATTYFLMKFQVEDNGGTANGGQNLDPNPKILDVRFMAGNHPPMGKSATLNAVENKPYVYKTADFGFSDPYDHPSNILLAVKITILPTSGTLTDNGSAVIAGQFVSAADISNGKLVFKPKTNLTGGPYFMVQFQVQDNGGTANGGSDLDPNPKVLDVEIL